MPEACRPQASGWCSSLVSTITADRGIRICLDLQVGTLSLPSGQDHAWSGLGTWLLLPSCSQDSTRPQGFPPPPRAGQCQPAWTHTAMLDRSFWTSLDLLVSALQSSSSFTQNGWLQGQHRQGMSCWELSCSTCGSDDQVTLAGSGAARPVPIRQQRVPGPVGAAAQPLGTSQSRDPSHWLLPAHTCKGSGVPPTGSSSQASGSFHMTFQMQRPDK